MPKMREGFSRKDMLKSLLSTGVNSHDIHRRPPSFWKVYTSRNAASLDQKGGESRLWSLQILQAGNRLIKLLGCKHVLLFIKKKDNTEGNARV